MPVLFLCLFINACGGDASGGTSAPVGAPLPVTTPPAPPASPAPAPLPTPPRIVVPVPAPPPSGATLVAAGIDSLTAGGGDVWRRFFAQTLRGGLGDGGPGYASFSAWGAGEVDAGLERSGRLDEFAIDSADGRLSIDGAGVATPDGDGSGRLFWRPASDWTQARIYFLRQPGGGSMKCYNKVEDPVAAMIIATDAATPELGHVDVGRGSGEAGRWFGCSDVRGRVTLFGALVTRQAGLLMASWARGGRSLADVAAQDSRLRRAWFAELKPAFYILNAGTNDQGKSPVDFEANLRTVAADIAAASPSTRLIIVQPNETRYTVSDPANYAAFEAARRRVAADAGARFADVRSVLGSYEQSIAAGFLGRDDGVHPSIAANRVIGPWLAGETGLDVTRADPGPAPYQPGS